MNPKSRYFEIDTQRLLDRPLRIAILLNPKLAAHSEVMRGISDFVESNGINWSIVLSQELRHKKTDDIELWFDGIIADYSHEHTKKLLEPLNIPVVGILSGTDQKMAEYKHPIVCLDNEKMITLAHDFLNAKGLEQIGFYSLFDDDSNPWQKTRTQTYLDLQSKKNRLPILYQGNQASFSSWIKEYHNLAHWIHGLVKPCGIIVTSDARARTLVSVCEEQQIAVPDEISIVSIGDMRPTDYFNSTTLSVVDPNFYQLGQLVGRQLKTYVAGEKPEKMMFASPELIVEGSSTDLHLVVEPMVLRALYFIRKNFNKGIKVQQVVESQKYSRTRLESKFKESVGHSIHTEIYRLKLDFAVQLLLEKDEMSIDEIARKAGYPSAHYFYSLFKKEFSLTPTEYKSAKNDFEESE
ncbi:helix-turn-helix domain-containing protein [Alginatibacterium sediminis]|uniref:Helix-turn-helix domain-containing protein n=1 Tax=Alginatibacterium sediminis TaxID=2164068 RepID=A0A420E9W8_9ALTE|nr:substrate-binding domain-containing protein [Alginatibacterium sediminis]RKF17476.1 helix-turn-helix domain-containing protein [Alginatibacterium sediminis]